MSSETQTILFWSNTSNILTNETYRGSKRLQKTFCTNYLTKKKKTNEGELPMYYIEESHEPIIPPDEFDAVQAEIERRKEMGTAIRSLSPFSSKIICGDCGAYFGKKTWSSTSEKYRKEVWRCNARYKTKGQRTCRTIILMHIGTLSLRMRKISIYIQSITLHLMMIITLFGLFGVIKNAFIKAYRRETDSYLNNFV